ETRVPCLAADASRRASLLVAYIHPVCALLAPCRAGASTTRHDTLISFRVLTSTPACPEQGRGAAPGRGRCPAGSVLPPASCTACVAPEQLRPCAPRQSDRMHECDRIRSTA